VKTPPLALSVPRTWSPEQALAVWETLRELADLVWAQYEIPIIEQFQHEQIHCACGELDQLDLFDPNDALPF